MAARDIGFVGVEFSHLNSESVRVKLFERINYRATAIKLTDAIACSHSVSDE